MSKVLDDKDLSNHLGQEASKLIIDNYDIDVCSKTDLTNKTGRQGT